MQPNRSELQLLPLVSVCHSVLCRAAGLDCIKHSYSLCPAPVCITVQAGQQRPLCVHADTFWSRSKAVRSMPSLCRHSIFRWYSGLPCSVTVGLSSISSKFRSLSLQICYRPANDALLVSLLYIWQRKNCAGHLFWHEVNSDSNPVNTR